MQLPSVEQSPCTVFDWLLPVPLSLSCWVVCVIVNVSSSLPVCDAQSGGHAPFVTFMGVPREVVVACLKDKDNKIAVSFVLEGDVNNPQFSLNETLATRLASSMAGSLG